MGLLSKIGRFVFFREIEVAPPVSPIEEIVVPVEEVKPEWIKKRESFLYLLQYTFSAIEQTVCPMSMKSAISLYNDKRMPMSDHTLYDRGIIYSLIGSDTDEPSLSLRCYLNLSKDVVITVLINNSPIVSFTYSYYYKTNKYVIECTPSDDVFDSHEELWTMISDKVLDQVLEFFKQMEESFVQKRLVKEEEERAKKETARAKALADITQLNERLES